MNLNIIIFAAISLLESLQVLIIIVFIFSFIPMATPAFVQKLFPVNLDQVHMERENSFYHYWVAAAVGVQALLLFFNRTRLQEEGRWHRFIPYLTTIAAIIFVQIFAAFKIFVFNNPPWARYLLEASIGVGVLARIFWPEVERWAGRIKIPSLAIEAAALLTLTVVIFLPSLQEVLARMLSYDKFYHLDSFIMAPAWAHHQGLVLNKDIISEYSLILPVVFDALLTAMGGVTYAHAVALMIILCAAYCFALYGIWRYWLNSSGIAFFGLALLLKLQFFHWGIVPLIWIYPSATPLRCLPDIFFLFFILRFCQNFQLRWLVLSALASGMALVWTMDVGVYVFVTLLMAAGSYIYLKGRQAIGLMIGIVAIPWVLALSILFIFYGPLIFQASFWQRSFEFISLFIQGWGALPMTDGLHDRQFFAFCMGFIIPVVYLGTLLYTAALFIFRRQYLFIALISVYGLGLYHYFIYRSGVSSYDAVIVPFIFVILFWVRFVMDYMKPSWQKVVKVVACCGAMGALLTSFLFLYYPNCLNLSQTNWKPEITFYSQMFDFSQDARLIDNRTLPSEKVPVISSFETKILMQADRRPFFYYFPFMESEYMQGNTLRGTYMHTYARLSATIHQLQEERPAYIFIQTRLWQGAEAQNYEKTHEGFKQLMAFIRRHYQEEGQGQYLTALKIKS